MDRLSFYNCFLFVSFLLLPTGAFCADTGIKTLSFTKTTSINKGGFSVLKVEDHFEVLSSDGALKRANYDISSEDPRESFVLVKATIRKGPNEVEVQSDQVHRTKQFILDSDERQTPIFVYRVPLRQIRVGSVVHLVYELKRPPAVPGLFDMLEVVRRNSESDNEKRIILSDSPLKIESQGSDEEFLLKESKENGKYKVEVVITETARSSGGKEKIFGTFFVSNATSWKLINQRLAPRYNLVVKEELPVQLDAVVRKANLLKLPGKKIEFVIQELHKVMTYSGSWRPVEGKYFPAGLQNSIQVGRGDCKDFSTATVAVLNKIGFKSHVALTYQSQKGVSRTLYKKMVSVPNLSSFNHAIVWAQDPTGKVWWIDPSTPKIIAHIIPADLLGNNALVLNGNDSQLRALPERNNEPWQVQLSQTMELGPDGTVEVISRQEYNETSYHSILQAQQRLGSQNGARALISMIDPSKDIAGQSAFKSDKGKYIYDVRFKTPHLLQDKKGASLAFKVYPVISRVLEQRVEGGDLDLGEEGTFISETVIKRQKALDPIESECVVKSPWADFEREIQVVESDTKVLDRFHIKKQYVLKVDVNKDRLTEFYSDISQCQDRENLIVRFQTSRKRAEDLDWEKLRGPSVEMMTEGDVMRLKNLRQPTRRDYIAQKLYRYFSNRIKKSEFDVTAYAERAAALRSMGGRSYLDAAMEDVLAGERKLGVGFDVKLSQIKALTLADLGDMKAALLEFSKLQKKSPESYETAATGFYLANLTENNNVAKQWLKVALSRAKMQHQTDYVQQQLELVKARSNPAP